MFEMDFGGSRENKRDLKLVIEKICGRQYIYSSFVEKNFKVSKLLVNYEFLESHDLIT